MAVLTIVLRLGITSAFFRFYFDADDDDAPLRVVRTSFWFTMGMATLGLVVGLVFAEPIARFLHVDGDIALVQAGFVWLWTQMNYAQITSLFRVEQRPVAFAIATVANVLITIGATIALVVGARQGRRRRGGREPARDARRLRRAARLPALPARAHVRPRSCCAR